MQTSSTSQLVSAIKAKKHAGLRENEEWGENINFSETYCERLLCLLMVRHEAGRRKSLITDIVIVYTAHVILGYSETHQSVTLLCQYLIRKSSTGNELTFNKTH